MKSCLTIFFLFFLIATLWWSYNSYSNHCDCEECKKNLTKYYLHFEGWEHWNKTTNYYLLECFCDKKAVLKKTNTMRKNIIFVTHRDVALLKDNFYESGERY